MEDEKIVSLYWQRRESAITETQSKYGSLCYSVAFRILQSKEDAEECVNDTLVRLWNSIPPELPDNFAGFLCRITRNLALDRLKSQTAEKRAHTSVAVMEELEHCFPASDGADSVIDKLALTRAFERFLASEPPAHRMIFMRRYFYMDSTRDIARMMKMTETGVRVSLFRIRMKLKKHLEDEGISV